MPTFMLFKNGQKVEDLVGANPGALTVRYSRFPSCSCTHKINSHTQALIKKGSE